MYPRRSIESTGLFLTFRAYNYGDAPTPDGALADIRDILSGVNSDLTVDTFGTALTDVYGTGGTEGTAGIAPTATREERDANNTGVANISLYLPPKVEYQYGAEWQKVSFGALGSMFGTEDAGGFVGAGAAALAGTMANAGLQFLTNNKAFSTIPKVDNISADTLVGAAFGQTFNDNTLQTFNKMQTRSFSFDYLFVARDAKEEEEIRKIIKVFKLGMHPESKQVGRSNSLFLKYPLIWRIIPSGYKGKLLTKSGGVTKDVSAETPQVSEFLPNTKYCGLKSMNVDYTPDNVMALTQGGFVQAVKLSLQFDELTTLVRQDIDGFEDKTEIDASLRSALGLK